MYIETDFNVPKTEPGTLCSFLTVPICPRSGIEVRMIASEICCLHLTEIMQIHLLICKRGHPGEIRL